MNYNMDKSIIAISLFGQEYSSQIVEIEQKQHFFCYMDLLGSKRNMSDKTDRVYINEFYAITDLCRKIHKARLPFLKVNTFSDSICLLSPLPSKLETAKLDFHAFLIAVATIQALLLTYTGQWVRGGITVGDAFVDDFFVWGEALTHAYHIEEKEAIVPIIAIDPKIIETYVEGNCNGLVMKKDGHGLPFVNYFAAFDEQHVNLLLERNYKNIKKRIENKEILEDYQPNPWTDKLAWMCGYNNLIACKFKRDDLILAIPADLNCEEPFLLSEMFFLTPETSRNS